MRITQPDISKTRVRRGASWQRYYCVTLPKFGGGRSRRFFPSTPGGKCEAETLLQLARIQQKNEGMAAFSIPQELRIETVKCQRLLQTASATLTEAVQF